MKWEKPPVDTDLVKEIARRYEIDLLTAAILVRRGKADPAIIPYYLESGLNYLHSPFLFGDMANVVERIFQARDEGEIVLVYGDRDVDGITSTTVMVQTLRELGIEVRWRVPEGDEAYGLTMEAVDALSAENGTLIITVDCGITNIEEIVHAEALGIDTIVVDHHNPKDDLPPAIAVINPKVGDEYPFDGLCGCALAAKVRQAVAFGATDLFGAAVTLLNVRPANESIIVDAVQLENNIEVDRISEALVPGVGDFTSSRLANFLQGQKLVCYDEAVQKRLLKEVLGSRVDIYMLDLLPEVESAFPSLRGKSLLQMREGSRLARYRGKDAEEIDVLVALYQSVADVRFPAIRTVLESVSDLVAVATLADMMPIENENRILVRTGLQRLNSAPQPGLFALMQRLKLVGKTIASRDISWGISPVLNASGRMGSPELAVALLLSDDEARRTELANEVFELNGRRRRIGDDGWKAVFPVARDKIDAGEEKVLVIHEPSINRGVTGIIAGRLAKQFNLPAVVLTNVDEMAIGSIRSARGFIATDFLARFDGVLSKWGGHNEAAGFSFPVERLDEFWKLLQEVVETVSLDESREKEIIIDAELPAKYFNPELEAIVRSFEPYGQANSELRFLARSLFVEKIDFIGKSQEHLRLLLSGGGFKWPAVYWNAAEYIPERFELHDRVDIVFEFTKNFYNGNETIQLVIQDSVRSENQIAR